jgi:hypothetical protein
MKVAEHFQFIIACQLRPLVGMLSTAAELTKDGAEYSTIRQGGNRNKD